MRNHDDLSLWQGIESGIIVPLWLDALRRTDPGAGFPMDVLLEKAKNLQKPAPETQKEEDMFTDKYREKLDRIHHELTHRLEFALALR